MFEVRERNHDNSDIVERFPQQRVIEDVFYTRAAKFMDILGQGIALSFIVLSAVPDT